MKLEMDYSRGSAIPQERYLKSQSFADSIAGKPAHIYQKPDFGNDDSMGKKRMLALCNRLHMATSCDTFRVIG